METEQNPPTRRVTIDIPTEENKPQEETKPETDVQPEDKGAEENVAAAADPKLDEGKEKIDATTAAENDVQTVQDEEVPATNGTKVPLSESPKEGKKKSKNEEKVEDDVPKEQAAIEAMNKSEIQIQDEPTIEKPPVTDGTIEVPLTESPNDGKTKKKSKKEQKLADIAAREQAAVEAMKEIEDAVSGHDEISIVDEIDNASRKSATSQMTGMSQNTELSQNTAASENTTRYSKTTFTDDSRASTLAGPKATESAMELSISYIEMLERSKKKQDRKRKDSQRHKVVEDLEIKMEEQKVKKLKDSMIISTHKSEDVDTEYELETKKKLLLDGTYDEILMQELEIGLPSDSSSSYDPTCTVSFKEEFLANFDELPSISDISEEISIEIIEIPEVESVVEVVPEDVGHFVDPLTGALLESSSESTVAQATVEESVEEEVQVDESDELLQFSEDSTAEPYFQLEEDIDFLKMIELGDFGVVGASATDLQFQKAQREIRKIAIDFLFELINEVVEMADYIDPMILMGKKLNKAKLMQELLSAMDKYLQEKHNNQFINLKIVEHYKRLRAFRAIKEMEPAEEKRYKAKYREALDQLDHNYKIQATVKRNRAFLMSSVYMDINWCQRMADSSETSLKEAMHKLLIRKDSEFMKRVVDHALRVMRDLSNEISDTRFLLISRKHTMARLDERINKLEHINETLLMSYFISIQNEVQTMGKKLEERHSDLMKQRSSYYQELHELSHLRERGALVRYSLDNAKQIYFEHKEIEKKLRDRLFKVKMERSHIRQQNQDLVDQGGLLTNPSLMYDYDATVDRINLKKEAVSKHKETIITMTKRIAAALSTLTY